jgi:hypothetical protein
VIGNERPVVAGDENGGDKADLDQRRQDGEQREADQGRDAALAPLDVARESAGVPREVKAQRQRVQVPEDFQRNRPHRPLRHLGEQELAQLGEERRRQAQQPVPDEKRERNREDRRARVERVDDRFEQDGHADVRDLGRDQGGERQDDAPLVCPEVR